MDRGSSCFPGARDGGTDWLGLGGAYGGTSPRAGCCPCPSTRFRLYSLATAIVVLLFGAATGSQSPNIADGEPTPWMGLYERVSVGAWLLWMAVLAVVLWRDASRAL